MKLDVHVFKEPSYDFLRSWKHIHEVNWTANPDKTNIKYKDMAHQK